MSDVSDCTGPGTLIDPGAICRMRRAQTPGRLWYPPPFERFGGRSCRSAGRPVMLNARIRRTLPVVVCVALLLAGSIAAQQVPRLDSYKGVAVRILQSNNAGNIHHIIDPARNQVVGLIRGCPYAHNL